MNLPRYPEYKPSGVEWLGEVPRHWEIKKLKFVALVQPSNVDKKTEDNEVPVLLCNYTDVYKNEYIDSSFDFMKATATTSEIEKFSVDIGDVIVTKDSESPEDIAVPACVVEKVDGLVCGYHLTQIKGTKIDGKYLFRLFQSKGFNAQFVVAANGVTRFGLPQYAISNAFASIPSEKEQQTIARFLDHKTVQIDALITKKEALLEKLAEKRTALISHAVTKGLDSQAKMKDSGVEWLGQVPEHWEVKSIKYLTKILRGKFTHRPRNDPRFYDGEYPFIQTGDIANASKYISTFSQTLNEDGLKVSKEFPAGTLVMTIAANIGDMAILDFNACFPDSIVGFVPKENVNLDFLYYTFVAMKQKLMSTAVLNTQLNLNIDRISSQFAALPPFEEQVKIAGYLESGLKKLGDQEVYIEKAIEKLKEYRSALITQAVTGKIDVRRHEVSLKAC